MKLRLYELVLHLQLDLACGCGKSCLAELTRLIQILKEIAMELQIPKAVKAPLGKFAALHPDEARQFASAVREAKPTLSIKDFSAGVASKAGMEQERAHEFVALFVGMYLARIQFGRTLDEFLSDLLTALQTAEDEEFPIGDKAAFEGQVRAVLQSDSLGITAKAQGLLTDHEHAFHSCRILSDVRYIFGDDPDKQPQAAVITHLLNIVYTEIDGLNQIYFALDASDLKKLKAAIERAEAKEKNLRAMLVTDNINCLHNS